MDEPVTVVSTAEQVSTEVRLTRTQTCSITGVDAIARPWEVSYKREDYNNGVTNLTCNTVSGVVNAVRCDLGYDSIGISTWTLSSGHYGYHTDIYSIPSSTGVSCTETLN